jgi:serine/threonine protein kinase/WD40 repeat protein
VNESQSTADVADDILAQFLQAFEKAADRDAVVSDFCAAHPELADDARTLAGMNRMVEEARPDGGEEMPRSLGEFRILREIGHGGMGKIYEAWHERLRRRVAVKTIRQRGISLALRVKFMREQRVLAQLHQTHIVPIHAAGEEGPMQYFVMPYIKGAALDRAVETARKLETSRPHSKTLSLAELAGVVSAESEQLSGRPAPGPARDAFGTTQTSPWFPNSSLGTKGMDSRPGERWSERASEQALPRAAKVTLSMAYFRSVAQVMADTAEALQHAHDAHVLHRDLKPANLMVDMQGHCWIIDFGLARLVNGQETKRTEPPEATPSADALPSQGAQGTLQYMAPEQYLPSEQHPQKVDARTDVWGLGVTLYELLTLHRAFDGANEVEIRTRILSTEPQPPRKLVANLPADLAAICGKAIRKEAGRRYQTAQGLADDLRRWLKGEPTSVRRGPSRRAWLWANRNKGWAAAIILGVAAGIVFGVINVLLADARIRTAVAVAEKAEVDTAIARERMNAAEEEVRQQRRELSIQKLERLRLNTHHVGWSGEGQEMVREIARLEAGGDLRDQAAATFIGMDAHLVKRFDDIMTSFLAFDREGKRLLMGGSSGQAAQLWDGTINEPISSTQTGPGPVTFRADGTPLHIAMQDPYTYRLCDVTKRRDITEFKIAVKEDRKAWPKQHLLPMALSSDGAFFAASPALPEGKGILAVWESATGKLLHQFSESFTGLAFSPSAADKKTLLAAGGEDGSVTVWSLPKCEKLGTFRAGRLPVQALAFRPNLRRTATDQAERSEPRDWLLAVGEAGGSLVIWDLRTLKSRSYCHGSSDDVYIVAFSPDGMTLASGGRGKAKLWDVATGRLLLNLSHHDATFALAFAPDGRSLAVGSFPGFGHSGGVDVWRLESGRGIESLRGLVGKIARVYFSPDGRFVAALAHNWELAIWDLKANRLSFVLEAPFGLFSDNAGFAFDTECRRFAFAAGRHAKMWEHPPGLGDQLAFHPSGQLLSFRWETQDMKHDPTGRAHPREHPRVCRIRNLLGPKPEEPIKEIKDFNWAILGMGASPDGSHFVVEGKGGANGKTRMIKVFDGLTGDERWTIPIDIQRPWSSLALDPSGRILAIHLEDDFEKETLVELSSGKVLRRLARFISCIGPAMRHWCGAASMGYPLYRRDDKSAVAKLGIDTVNGGPASFNFPGTHLAWGTGECTVLVCEIAEVQRRLAELGLGW